MSILLKPSEVGYEKLLCRKWGAEEVQVSFEATTLTRNSSVLIKIGDVSALVSRETISAAAILWPVEEKR